MPLEQPPERPAFAVFLAPTINSIFGPTGSFIYWSSSTFSLDPSFEGVVTFDVGNVILDFKVSDNYVRAVRGGP